MDFCVYMCIMAGLRWINGTARCLTEKLSPLYTSPFQRCSDIRDTGASAMVECNDREESDGTDFCWFVRENTAFYTDVVGGSDIFRIVRLGPRVIAKMLTEAAQCGATALSDQIASFTSSLGDIFQSFVDRLDNLFGFQ